MQQLELLTNSLLVVSQIREYFEVKDPIFQRYLARVRELLKPFTHVEVKHVPCRENVCTDILSTLASTKKPGNL